MKLHWGRIFAATLSAEIAPVLLLVAAVALFGPSDAVEAQSFAERLGRWVGPSGGALATFVFATWAASPSRPAPVVHGTLVGAFAAALDAGLLVASSAAFEWLFVFSEAGRIAAGTLGGYWARSRS